MAPFFTTASIDAESPVPAYYQLYEALRAEIVSRHEPGARVPNERTIAAQIGVSRTTLRQAFTRLEWDGLLHRRQGDGTYIAERRVAHDVRYLHGFTREFTARGSRVRSQILSVRSAQAPASLRETLGVAGPDSAVELRRVRWLDGSPASLETVWLPRPMCDAILEEDLTDRSLYATLATLGIVPTHGNETLTATTLDEFEAQHLEQRPGAPAMLVERAAFDSQDRCVECVKTLLRADRFAIHTPLDLH